MRQYGIYSYLAKLLKNLHSLADCISFGAGAFQVSTIDLFEAH